ncbi:zinc finger A20 and AN1 domain-containing stress-associated protein 4 isoform X1 [Sesamum indicum]|uniref:Zinc finger A20 and AN1 domain-containing stress-associated protein 4 isoform X1 n=1 Tax=Sesamum indicum TaxID=4182 RepID=A0A6I9U2B8_SESIN|nr:zinc finger A20 and AN1 domain-containing stress-associated protein 4 isoform X2 [Sesamum indicum]XP_011094370.1 zinc finger A20 and AN1 domain-containing stress-associated protein 4 isoform X1 [Sesamum indicum]
MAEEHGFQAPEGHRLCVNNCGFFGSPATQNMCSKCYRDLSIKKSADFSTPSTAPPPSTAAQLSLSSPDKAESSVATVAAQSPPMPVQQQAQPQPQPPTNRCSTCRKKVGLTGFRCRCGITFCGSHRYPEKHGCTFDFKAMGREAIAKANPVVKADKLDKI